MSTHKRGLTGEKKGFKYTYFYSSVKEIIENHKPSLGQSSWVSLFHGWGYIRL